MAGFSKPGSWLLLPLLLLCASLRAAQADLHPAIYSLAFSPDGKTLAVGTHKQALLYNTATWSVSSTFTQVQSAVRSIAFHPDGTHIALGSGINGVSGDLLIWDTSKPEKVVHYQRAQDTIESIAFAKDGSSMLTASFDSKARLYPQTFYGYGPKLEEHNGRITAVAFSPKPNYIFVTGAMDKMAKVWDVKQQRVVVNFDQASAGITGLGFLGNGDQFVGSSMDGNLYWWGVGYDERKRTYSGYHFRTIKAHEDGVTAFGVSGNQQRMITGGMDHRVKVWKIDDGGLIREFKEPVAPIYCAALSPDGKIAVAAGREGVLWIWDVEANKLLNTITPPTPPQPVPVTTSVASSTGTSKTTATPAKAPAVILSTNSAEKPTGKQKP